jgi:fumarate hydratase subunit beta
MIRQIQLPLEPLLVRELRAGDELELTGEVLTGRDQACARLFEMIIAGKTLPVSLERQLLYFVGPSPAPPGHVIGSAGPTTTGRMNQFIPTLLQDGLAGVIGKGYLADDVKQALCRHGAVYLGAVGGLGALLSKSIEHAEVIAFEELLSEAMRRLALRGFPVVVLNDAHGGDLYAAAAGQGRIGADR